MKPRPLAVTVFALLTLLAAGAAPRDDGWVSLFDGKSLDGWKREGGNAAYRVEDGTIVGTTVEGSPNTFLTRGDYADFELEFEVKCDPRLNSGVQFRSHVYGKDQPNAGVVYGPQCEIAALDTHTAARVYDEGRRGRWLCEITPEAQKAFKDNEWNQYKIIAKGNRYQTFLNGVLAADFTDDEDKSGLIGLQVHGIPRDQGPYEVRWRNIRIRELK